MGLPGGVATVSVLQLNRGRLVGQTGDGRVHLR